METNKNPLVKIDELRRRAENYLIAQGPKKNASRTVVEMQSVLHELQVHQIQLEMQNSELRQARDEVENALEKYTDLYDFAPVGYLTLDRDGVIHAANLSGAALLGVERSRLAGWHFGQFVTKEHLLAFKAFLGKVFTSQVKEVSEVALLNENRQQLIVQIEALATASMQNCRLALIDITERKRAEEEVERLNADLTSRAAELEAANVELEAFNYSVSHDLRRPLTLINSLCQEIEELCGDKLDPQCRNFIQEINEGSLRMNRLIDTLLTFSSVSRVAINHELVDLSAKANSVAAELKLATPENRVTFQITDGIVAEGDPGLLQVVLDNLIGNAWKFAGSREEAVIEFGATEVDGKPAYFVRDNGPGFDMALADKLFIPFQRLVGAGTEGQGIGLATVERIVRRHGGKVWAVSQPGKGATFYFTLE
ncbi:sensor histidine kinase [Desulfurivibrio dismutans]|uniref:sensor histidine kinase n=1 Tax=Desulfurivibrio dismutans TaxID=1398908 RepID=UPI0023D9BB77|nr:ATP-binding protein [Desulfurivibrio alkaliphilus]MDF1614896.1 ATP-binding protein [Desulfurivibrio alkaliphilus]